ncbi:MAG: flagellar basal body P-ring protein FlgI [Phycisphaerae bacterium]|nr:flagellar basal body P-ring protein FlgI [Phycisphaerae bacterium]
MTQDEWDRFWHTDKGSQPDPTPRLISKTKATRGTVGELVTVDGLRLLQVRGFGLVVDLPDTGGSDGPEVVKSHIIKEMRRREKPGRSTVSPSEMLKGRDTALVEVSGLIPAAANKGDTFDVVVRAMGTQTTSLASGRLFLCDLKPHAEDIDSILGAKTIATATGPMFISPIGLEKEVPDKIDLRKGLVLGGGIVKRPRKVRLVLNDPSPSTAARIVDRINGRYTKRDPIAEGTSYSAIELTIPRKYRSRKSLFLEYILHTTLNSSPAALQRRTRELVQEIAHPDAEFEAIGIAWEAIGRIVLPDIQELYYHQSPATNYYAARTGMRLGDNAGMEAVVKHALDPESPFRHQAVEELGYAVDMHGAGECLRKLLGDSDTAIRVRAYRGLRRRPHPAIQSKVLYQDNLVLDVLDSTGPYLICVQRSATPRIAVFGEHVRCRPPAMYPGERRDERFLHTQISAQADNEDLTVIYKNKRTGRASPKLSVPFSVPDLIRFLGDTPTSDADGKMEALAVPYDEIVDILYTFCQTGAIPAEFIAEDLTGTETAGDIPRERRESEYQ